MSKSLLKTAMQFASSALLLTSVASLANADVQFGGTRAAGMGGAGLALPIDVTQNFRLNPSFLGYTHKRFSAAIPGFGYRFHGVSYDDIKNEFGSLSSGGISETKIVDFAKKFGDSEKNFGINASLGFNYSEFALSADGEANINTTPNASLANFVKSGNTDYTQVPLDSRLDAYGLGYYQVLGSYGHTFKLPYQELSIGGSGKFVESYYAHKVVDATSIMQNTAATNGVDVPGNANAVNKTGFGVDFGALYTNSLAKGLYLGSTVDNLIEPNIHYAQSLPNMDAISGTKLSPFQRRINGGLGYVNKSLLLAADYGDIGNHAGMSDGRFGAEYDFGKVFAVRAGYNTRTQYTLGFSIVGINVAFSKNAPLTIGTSIKF